MNVPDFRRLTMERAVSLLEQHVLYSKPDKQSRKDWLEEMSLPFVPDPDSEGLRFLVESGAAVDLYDALDISNTERLCVSQPHRAAELRKALTDRRLPRKTADLRRRQGAAQAGNQSDVTSDAGAPVA